MWVGGSGCVEGPLVIMATPKPGATRLCGSSELIIMRIMRITIVNMTIIQI